MSEEFQCDPSAASDVDELERATIPFIDQAGALCLRQKKGKSEVLLIKGRRNGKWGIPKGGIETGETSAQAAAREAFEEAGVSGPCEEIAFDVFWYQKQGKAVRCRVSVHRMNVVTAVAQFPEANERTLNWVDCDSAADLVDDDGLRRILEALA